MVDLNSVDRGRWLLVHLNWAGLLENEILVRILQRR